MNIIVSILITLGLTFYLGYKQTGINQQVEEYQWNHFMAKYSKIYESQQSHESHKQTFMINYRFIYEQNQLYFNNQSQLLLDVNQYADLSNDQFRSQYGGFNRNGIDWYDYYDRIQNDSMTDIYQTIPYEQQTSEQQTLDWRLKGGVTTVRNQGQCGSCWTFASTGALSTLKFISDSDLIDLSVQNLMDCSIKNGNNGCKGGTMNQAYKYVIDNGLEGDSTYPYQAKQYKCRQNVQNNRIRIQNYVTIKPNNSTLLKQGLKQNTISVAVDGNGLYMQFYKKGIFDKCGTDLDHAVLLIGYGQSDGWGSDWGENGYIRIRDNDPNGKGVCGVQMYSSYPVII